MPGVHGLALSMHHGPLKPPLQEVAGQPDCSVAHAPPSTGLVQVSRHSHVESICCRRRPESDVASNVTPVPSARRRAESSVKKNSAVTASKGWLTKVA